MEKVKNFISTHQLIPAGGDVVVALSGGADSVALLSILCRLGYKCVAAHCNFHLRGPESDRDMNHVVELCRRLNVPLEIKHFDVETRIDETGESVEMACRSLRYEWFDSLLQSRPGAVLAVGHHLEDNVETFMLNAMRRSGVAGLKGMLPRNGRVVRPLLCLSRAEIEQYLASKGLDYVTDSSNASNDYRRNRLRNIVLPALEAQFPGAEQSIAVTMDYLRDDYLLLTHYDSLLSERYVDAEGAIDVSALCSSHPYPWQALRRLMGDTSVTGAMIDSIVSHPEASGLIFGNYTLHRGKLRKLQNRAFDAVNVVPGEGVLEIKYLEPDDFHPCREPYTIWLDDSALAGNPRWELRPWREGDRFRPFGMKGTKLVSDLMTQHGLDYNAKHDVRILTRNDEIIWVAPLRASDLFRVTKDTKHIIQLTLNLPQ